MPWESVRPRIPPSAPPEPVPHYARNVEPTVLTVQLSSPTDKGSDESEPPSVPDSEVTADSSSVKIVTSVESIRLSTGDDIPEIPPAEDSESPEEPSEPESKPEKGASVSSATIQLQSSQTNDTANEAQNSSPPEVNGNDQAEDEDAEDAAVVAGSKTDKDDDKTFVSSTTFSLSAS